MMTCPVTTPVRAEVWAASGPARKAQSRSGIRRMGRLGELGDGVRRLAPRGCKPGVFRLSLLLGNWIGEGEEFKGTGMAGWALGGGK